MRERIDLMAFKINVLDNTQQGNKDTQVYASKNKVNFNIKNVNKGPQRPTASALPLQPTAQGLPSTAPSSQRERNSSTSTPSSQALIIPVTDRTLSLLNTHMEKRQTN